MPTNLFVASNAKIERAKSQIEDLDSKVSSFLISCGHTHFRNVDSSGIEVWRFRLNEPIPIEFSLIVGEILHTLRSSLDLMMSEIARINDKPTKNVYFPFGKSREIFEQELKKKTESLPDNVHNLLCSLKPYKGGNKLLWALHDWNRLDKHVSIVAITQISRVYVQTLVAIKGQIFTVGPRCGRHLYFDGKNLVQPHHSKQPRIVSSGKIVHYQGEAAIDFGHIPESDMSPNDAYLSVIYNQVLNKQASQMQIPFSPLLDEIELTAENCMEFMTTTPDSEIYLDIQPTISICIDDIDIFPFLSVKTILNDMRSMCKSIIQQFQSLPEKQPTIEDRGEPSAHRW